MARPAVPAALPPLPARWWWEVLRAPGMTERLARDLQRQRWFGGKARAIESVTLVDVIPLPPTPAACALARVSYEVGSPEVYLLLLARRGRAAGAGVVGDALGLPEVAGTLLNAIAGKRWLPGWRGGLAGGAGGPRVGGGDLRPVLLGAEQSNSSIRYGRRWILKLLRRIEPGVHPDLEMGRFLTARGFAHVPPLGGWLEYRPPRGERATAAILQGFVDNRGDAWTTTLGHVQRYLSRVGHGITPPPTPTGPGALVRRAAEAPPRLARRVIGDYLDAAALLGRRTAELHLSLAEGREPAFRPEPLTGRERLALARGMDRRARELYALVRRSRQRIPRDLVRSLMAHEPAVRRRFATLAAQDVTAQRIRCHGDYHLGQVLDTGEDFVIIDFEGEPARPLPERRRKHAALRDVAGMLRSFHYAAHAAAGHLPAPAQRGAQPWVRYWYVWIAAAFLRAYLRQARRGRFLPREADEVSLLLEAYLLDKAVYEVSYELNNRPAWLPIPIRGIRDLVEDGSA